MTYPTLFAGFKGARQGGIHTEVEVWIDRLQKTGYNCRLREVSFNTILRFTERISTQF